MCNGNKTILCAIVGAVAGAVITASAIWMTCHFTKEPEPQCECDKAEYNDLMFEYKALSAEYAHLQWQCSGIFDLQEAYEEIAQPLPYYVPVDIQEPLPYEPSTT